MHEYRDDNTHHYHFQPIDTYRVIDDMRMEVDEGGTYRMKMRLADADTCTYVFLHLDHEAANDLKEALAQCVENLRKS